MREKDPRKKARKKSGSNLSPAVEKRSKTRPLGSPTRFGEEEIIGDMGAENSRESEDAPTQPFVSEGTKASDEGDDQEDQDTEIMSPVDRREYSKTAPMPAAQRSGRVGGKVEFGETSQTNLPRGSVRSNRMEILLSALRTPSGNFRPTEKPKEKAGETKGEKPGLFEGVPLPETSPELKSGEEEAQKETLIEVDIDLEEDDESGKALETERVSDSFQPEGSIPPPIPEGVSIERSAKQSNTVIRVSMDNADELDDGIMTSAIPEEDLSEPVDSSSNQRNPASVDALEPVLTKREKIGVQKTSLLEEEKRVGVEQKVLARKEKGVKEWFEEVFDDNYMRTATFITHETTAREADFLDEVLQPTVRSRILDLGCGDGRHAVELATRGYNVAGYDLSLPMLIRAADAA
ncbi:MAG: class I SAM-dependent methyltransferase, partial [Pseudomonadota bacterium]